MLKIVDRVQLSRATNPEYGNVQFFLERLLVDIVAANYRYFLNDHLAKSKSQHAEPHKICHFPLLENEKQIQGLISSALSGFCPVFRPEFSLVGEVDFMVTHGEREIALENKQVKVASVSAEIPKFEKKWKEVVAQSKRRMVAMKSNRARFRHPASIALLMVRPSRKITLTAKSDPQERAEIVREEALKDFHEGAMTLGKAATNLRGVGGEKLIAHFVAKYEFPREMQIISGWKSEKHVGGERVFPGVVFLANVSA